MLEALHHCSQFLPWLGEALPWLQLQTAASSPAAALKQKNYDFYVVLMLTLFFSLILFHFFLKQSVMTSEILK